MKALAVLLVLFAAPAEAATFQRFVDWAHCRLYPSHERCRPAPAPIPLPPQPQATPPPPPPAATPAPPRAVPPARAKRPAKAKYKTAPVRKRMAAAKSVPSWCARIPAGTSMATIEAWAPTFGVKMTAENRRKAQACLDSK